MRGVEEAGKAAFPAFRLRAVQRTPSTQDVVRAAARSGARAGFCCVAMEQSAGRGRQGRVWEAAPGAGLLMSVLLGVSPGVVGGVTLAAGVALAEAVERLGVPAGTVGVKWPNDLLVAGRAKLAGILAEVEPAARQRGGIPLAEGVLAPRGLLKSSNSPPLNREGGRVGSLSGEIAVVLGVGLNLGIDVFPPGTEGASLHTLLGRAVPWEEALAAVLQALGERLRELEAGGIPTTVAAWRRRAVGLGGPVEAHTPAGAIRGIAVDIADDGALLLDTGTEITRLLAGHVHLERP